MSDEWVVVGSGPSAEAYRHLCEGRKVACVNGSFGPCDPDVYGIFETAAYPVFGDRYEELHAKGVECYTRSNIVVNCNAPGVAVPLEMGYNATKLDSAPFNSAGVSMLNIVSYMKRPSVIRMIGFDGYGDSKLDGQMSAHIAQITNHYKGVKYIVHGRSNMPYQNRWRAEFVNQGV